MGVLQIVWLFVRGLFAGRAALVPPENSVRLLGKGLASNRLTAFPTEPLSVLV